MKKNKALWDDKSVSKELDVLFNDLLVLLRLEEM